MEHYYHSLSGENWFDYKSFYSFAINQLPNNSNMAEIGSWLGRSISYFAVESIIKNKQIKCYCIDIWKPYSEIPNHAFFENDLAYNQFLSNIEPIKNIVTPKRGESSEVCKEFNDQFFDFIFIDAAHDYDNVLKDLNSWYPKLKNNGLIGGHDWHHGPVVQAVNDFFANKKDKIKTNGNCWYIL